MKKKAPVAPKAPTSTKTKTIKSGDLTQVQGGKTIGNVKYEDYP